MKTAVDRVELARKRESQANVARFPTYKGLPDFDVSSSEMNEATVRQLQRGEFMEGAKNVIIIHCPARHTPASDGPLRGGTARNPN